VSEQLESPDVQENQKVDKSEEVIVVSKVTLNYVLIAVTFLMVGILIGLFGLSDNRDNINVTINEDQLREVMISVLEDGDFNFGGEDTANTRFALVDDDPYIGNEDAPIVIVEFSDFFCSFCKRHFDQTFTPVLENYGEHIRYVYRDFAQLTPESQPAAIAAECADEQGAFWDFHTEFFDNQQSLGRDFYISTAEQFELDIDAYTTCIDEARYNDEVEIDILDGQLEGVRGTPGFFINGQFISGAQPYAIFERVIQRELNQAGISYGANDAPAEDAGADDGEADSEDADA
jgi:protein-disulfide isomerase